MLCCIFGFGLVLPASISGAPALFDFFLVLVIYVCIRFLILGYEGFETPLLPKHGPKVDVNTVILVAILQELLVLLKNGLLPFPASKSYYCSQHIPQAFCINHEDKHCRFCFVGSSCSHRPILSPNRCRSDHQLRSSYYHYHTLAVRLIHISPSATEFLWRIQQQQ